MVLILSACVEFLYIEGASQEPGSVDALFTFVAFLSCLYVHNFDNKCDTDFSPPPYVNQLWHSLRLSVVKTPC